MENSSELEQIRLERDLIVRSAVICEATRMRIYSEYFDTDDWREAETFHELAEQFTTVVKEALAAGLFNEKSLTDRIKVILRDDHADGVYGMEQTLALAWRIQRVVADLKIGEPRQQISPAITY